MADPTFPATFDSTFSVTRDLTSHAHGGLIFQIQVIGSPVVSQPTYYTTPGYTGTITGQQWYRNTGTGPVAIAGATSASYTPVSGDVGAWLSVAVTSAGSTCRSQEFTALNQTYSSTPIATKTNPQTGYQYIAATQQTGVSTRAAAVSLRAVTGTSYIDSVVGPGSHPSTSTGDLSSTGALDYQINVYGSSPTTYPTPVVSSVIKSAATATRPAASTGVGCYVVNGGIYDSSGNKIAFRGINQVHYDSVSAGYWNSGSNVKRIALYMERDWATINKPLLDACITNSVFPMPSQFATSFAGTVSCSGNTLTVSSSTYGNLYVGFPIPAGNGFAACTITAVGTPDANGLAKTGTFTISGAAQTVASTTVDWGGVATSGNNTPVVLLAAAQNWADQYANYGAYEKHLFLNVANEWGPTASSTNTVWRDTYITAIGIIRTAGYKCPIVIDAGNSGQDNYGFNNHAAAILAADTQKNLVFSIHVYGFKIFTPGYVNDILASFHTVATTNAGAAFIVGEFGPGRLIGASPSGVDPREVMAVAEANDIGWIGWAWDDNNLAGGTSDDNWFAMVYTNGTGYSTSNSADLTIYGQQVVLDPVYGTAHSVKSPAFP